MHRLLMLFLLLLSTYLSAQNSENVEELKWLTGCWESVENNVQISENWMRPSGGTMLAISRTVKEGKTIAYEYIRIQQMEDGEIYFIAKPSGQNEASFKLVKASDNVAVFENPEHDFPQRITYRNVGEDILTARLENINDPGKAFDIRMKLIPCK